LHCAVLETSEAFRVRDERVKEGCVGATVEEIASGRKYELAPRLAGRFQLQNALNAVATARLLQERGYKISGENIERGVAATEWPGRIERFGTRPDVYFDGAHNPGAAKELAAFLEENFRGRKVYLVFGAMRDKAVDEVTGALFPQAYEVLFTEARTPRAISAAQLARMAGHNAERYIVYPEAESALEAALEKAKAEDAVFITGSLYLVGELRKVWKQRRKVASG